MGRFIYYDSGRFRGVCQAQADRLASKLAGRRVRTTLGENARQNNCYDCGMYVLMFSEIIINSFMECGSEPSAGTETKVRRGAPAWEKHLSSVTPADVTERRAALFRWLAVAVVGEDRPSAARVGFVATGPRQQI